MLLIPVLVVVLILWDGHRRRPGLRTGVRLPRGYQGPRGSLPVEWDP